MRPTLSAITVAAAMATSCPADAQIYKCLANKHGQISLDFGSKAYATKSRSSSWSNIKFGTFIVPSDRPGISTVVSVIEDSGNSRGQKYPVFGPPAYIE